VKHPAIRTVFFFFNLYFKHFSGKFKKRRTESNLEKSKLLSVNKLEKRMKEKENVESQECGPCFVCFAVRPLTRLFTCQNA